MSSPHLSSSASSSSDILTPDEIASHPSDPISPHASHHISHRKHQADGITGAADFHPTMVVPPVHHHTDSIPTSTSTSTSASTKPSHTSRAHHLPSLPVDMYDALHDRKMMSIEEQAGIAVRSSPLFRIGVFSDIQYADIDWRYNFSKTEKRWYRHAIHVTRRAIETWNKMNEIATISTSSSASTSTSTSISTTDEKLSSCTTTTSTPTSLSLHIPITCCIHFGDLIDLANTESQQQTQFIALERVLGEIDKYNGKIYHLLGNHELYNHTRAHLARVLHLPSSSIAYQSFSPHPSYRIILLDSYDIAMLGWGMEHEHYLQAHAILSKHNKNEDWNAPDGHGLNRRFTRFNGGISFTQLTWLENELKDATQQHQRVIIGAHIPFYPGVVCDPVCLAWNYDEILAVIQRYSCVVACLHGHDHDGGHAVDEYGIHHHVFEAVLVCPEGRSSYGHLDVFDDRLVLNGVDLMQSYVMHITPQQSHSQSQSQSRSQLQSQVPTPLTPRKRSRDEDERDDALKSTH